jgi:hypothetical protein
VKPECEHVQAARGMKTESATARVEFWWCTGMGNNGVEGCAAPLVTLGLGSGHGSGSALQRWAAVLRKSVLALLSEHG